MNQVFNLQPLGIERSEKVRWRFPYQGGDVVECIQSKKLRAFLREVDSVLASQQITVSMQELSAADFEQWLPYYHEKMSELGYDELATPEWYQDRVSKGNTVEGIFFHQRGTLIGSAIVLLGTDKATLAFKASDRLDLTNKPNSSLGAVVDFWFLKKMTERGIAVISGGQSRNAFGVINSLGYLDYKMKLGYVPSVSEIADIVQDIPLNDQGVVLFFGRSAAQAFAMYAIKPKDLSLQFEPARFATPEMPFIELEY